MRQVNNIVEQLEERNTAWKEEVMDTEGFALEHVGAYEYLSDVLDIEYVVTGSKEYLGARVLVAFGGPNIWINTRTNQVEGYWGGDSCIRHFNDNLGIDDVLREMWQCA